MKRLLIALTLVTATTAVPAAEPPDLINFQGVLRDASGAPEGVPSPQSFDMVFRFYDQQAGGSEILVDRHTAGDSVQVTVAGGLFNVELGSGAVNDGTGPGVYTSLAQVFRDHGEVWLRIEVAGEVLSPRVRVIATAYALNADHLDGRDAGFFLDTSTTTQTKAGKLILDASSIPGAYAIEGRGPGAGGYFMDTDNPSTHAKLGIGDKGIEARGYGMGGIFYDTDGTSEAHAAWGTTGVWGSGSTIGGTFSDSNNTGYANVGIGDTGIEAFGTARGGLFQDTNNTGYAIVGVTNRGIEGYGSELGGYFKDTGNTAETKVAVGDKGIEARGSGMGGIFYDTGGTSEAHVAWGTTGVWAAGTLVGGHFEDSDGSGYANVGIGNTGIEAYGGSNYGDDGIYATGYSGGDFESSDSSGGRAIVGDSNYGIFATHPEMPSDFLVEGGYPFAQVARLLGATHYKVYGSGTVSFVQNHPERSDRVVVYAAPEGNEVAVYTRGTARLVNGEARVELGETFKWVANPDVGLTAQLTPHAEPVALAVTSLDTETLMVRGPKDGPQDLVFDYTVWGLRIGYEHMPNVQEKTRFAPLPSREDVAAYREEQQELARTSALERFKAMRAASGETEVLDMSRSRALIDAIDRFDPEIDGTLQQQWERRSERNDTQPRAVTASAPPVDGVEPTFETPPRPDAAGAALQGGRRIADDEGHVYARSFRPSATNIAGLIQAAEPVRPGDVLVIDPEQPGMVSLARTVADAGVFGIVAEESGVVLGAEQPRQADSEETEPAMPGVREGAEPLPVPVALSGIALCKVDAGYGAIRPGDLLTTSVTPGHAMVAHEPRPGTILAKALEPLDAGTGLIKVLVMLR
jgi:hypothetical protein